MDTEQVDQLRASLASAFARADGSDLRRELRDFGWAELLLEEPQVAVSVAAELQGRRLATTAMIDDIAEQAASPPAGAAGQPALHLVCPPLGHIEPASHADRDRGVLVLDGVATIARERPHRFIAPVHDDGGLVLVTGAHPQWPAHGSGLESDSGFCRVTAEVALDECDITSGEPAKELWPVIEAAGRRVLAHELIGICAEMLAMTVEHVTSRQQFGSAIVKFQVVRHKLADVRLWLEVAQLAADAAWEDEGPTSAVMAKLLAGRLAREARVNCQQLLGGMGFTWEHPFHRYLRRALLLEHLLGDAANLRVHLGRQLLNDAELPALATLT